MDSAGASASGSVRGGRGPNLAKYEVLEEIGHGGMATVYRARDPRLARDVAVKVIHPHLRDSPEVKHRFFAEAKAVAKLKHRNIVEVYDVSGEGETEQYLVCELVRGVTLRQLLRDRGVVPPEVAAALGLELTDALTHAHAQGVVHRDVKPENVMVEWGPRAEGGAAAVSVSVKLMDFGIAKLLDAQGVTSTGQVLGSPAHMAPEQIEGGEVDGRADVFGLGVLLYECVVGHLPFEGKNPAQVLRRVLDGLYPKAERERATVGRVWSGVLDRALAQKPDDRWATPDAMASALRGELTRLGVSDSSTTLGAWLADGSAFEAAERPRLIEALCVHGKEARRRGDVLAAAADFNRALAYAPDDPVLLRTVTRLHRAEARARFLRRGARVALASVLLGAVAFLIARAFRPAPTIDGPLLATSGAAPHSSAALAVASAQETPAPTGSVPTTLAPPVPVPPPLRGGPPPVPREVPRVLRLSSLRPQHGVTLQVDNTPARDAVAGLRIDVDSGRPHQVRFACVQDICEPLTRIVEPGTDEAVLDVALTIKPAQLVVVDGEGGATYQVAEQPALLFRGGSPVSVPMRGGTWRVTVVELPSQRTRVVKLTAGKVERVSFAEL